MNLQGNPLDYIWAFFGGVLVSFSPCVYPLVPVTLGFIGAQGKVTRLKAFTLSLIYVLGLATTYSILGLFASLTGRLFGQISVHPVSFLVIGNVCIIAGLAFFEVIPISFTVIRLQGKVKSRGGYLSAFLLGLASGLVAGPCTAPALGAILLYVASRQNILYGTSLLFVFAYGIGVLLILTGIFGNVFFNLFKSEKWLNGLKKLAGLILLGAGEYFLLKAGRLM